LVQFDCFGPGGSGLDTSRNYLARQQGHRNHRAKSYCNPLQLTTVVLPVPRAVPHRQRTSKPGNLHSFPQLVIELSRHISATASVASLL